MKRALACADLFLQGCPSGLVDRRLAGVRFTSIRGPNLTERAVPSVLLVYPRHRKVDVRNEPPTAKTHILQGDGIYHQGDIVLADANLFYCVSGDQLRE